MEIEFWVIYFCFTPYLIDFGVDMSLRLKNPSFEIL